MPKRPSDAPEPRQSVNWVFTINNWIEDDKEALRAAAKDPAVKRVVWQEEICPTTGTPHLQGYVILAAKKTKLGLCRFMLGAARMAHFRTRPCYSDVVNSEIYCSNPEKTGAQNYEQHGLDFEAAAAEQPRTKEDHAKTIIQLAEKGDWATLKNEYPTQYLYCQTQFTKVFTRALEVPDIHDGVLDNYWVFGKPGAGKDQYIQSLIEAAGVAVYKKPANNKWWNEYAGQSAVWYQDLGKRARELEDDYKLWLDRHKQLVDTKHGMVWCNARTSYISSQYHPNDVFDADTADAIIRRVQLIEIKDGKAKWYDRENVERPPVAVREDAGPDPKRRRVHDPPSPDRFTSHPYRFHA